MSSNKLPSPTFWHVIAGKTHNNINILRHFQGSQLQGPSIVHTVYRHDIIIEYVLTCSFPLQQVQTPVRIFIRNDQWINKWILDNFVNYSKFQERCKEKNWTGFTIFSQWGDSVITTAYQTKPCKQFNQQRTGHPCRLQKIIFSNNILDTEMSKKHA